MVAGACGVDVMINVLMEHVVMIHVVTDEGILVRRGDVVEGIHVCAYR